MKKNRFKAFFINISLGLIIGLLISIVGGALVITFMERFVDKLLSDLVFATGIMAFGTIILAIASFWTIRQNYKFREKDRKERLLNEIIEWAQSLASWSEKKIAEGLITIYPTQENVLSIIFDRLSKQIDDIEKIKGRNIYILELSKTFHAEIKSSTNNIINQIDTLKEKLLEWKTEIGSKIANGIIVIRIDENDVS